MRFSDRDRHQIFLEPESLTTDQIYPNGISTSLPEDVQLAMIRSIRGLEEAVPLVIGYGIEHDVVHPTQLYPTLESKLLHGFYCAGQINGTTGYEEAGAQGLIAGINAALKVQGREPFILDRSSSYIGVLIDDLVTKGTEEPYRMFTSRVEYRLIVREDNADIRLGELGRNLGLLPEARYKRLIEKCAEIAATLKRYQSTRVKATEANNAILAKHNVSVIKQSPSVEELLRRPGMSLEILQEIDPTLLNASVQALEQVAIQIKYAGYIDRQLKDVKKFFDLEKIKIPETFQYKGLSGLSREIQDKLSAIKPVTLGQASRVSGVTPAAIMLLMIHLKK
jgi:tRNA uridine 5-carboxymethylaminomethyl modification enzyme